MVQRGSGEFEICKEGTLFATGRIRSPKNIQQEYARKFPAFDESESITVDGEEVYGELEQRGYQYRGLFREIVEARLSNQGEKYLHLSFKRFCSFYKRYIPIHIKIVYLRGISLSFSQIIL
jgi:hypothetical protein